MLVKHLVDQWKGNNYGVIPVNTPGEDLRKRLDSSLGWRLIIRDMEVEDRGDKQVSITRGETYSYKHELGDIIHISVSRSRSGKRRTWMIRYSSERVWSLI